MSRHQQAFKSTQIFDWDSEPVDERPTDFGSSTGFSTHSGYQTMRDVPASARRRREHRSGMIKLLASVAFILGLSSAGLMVMARYLQA